MAGAAFTGLFNVLTISLWALVPGAGLGYLVTISGVFCLIHTLRLHVGKLGAIDFSLGSFLLSLAVYFAQRVLGIWLIARPGQNEIVFILAYTLFGAMAVSLKRAWTLLQPARSGDNRPVTAVAPSPPPKAAELTGTAR